MPRDRIVGVDAARAVAIVGMVATHILPVDTVDGTPTLVGLLFDGRASALFAVLAGAGLALSTGGPQRLRTGREHAAAGAGIAVRAILIALIGLALADLDPVPLVILTYYGLLFLVAIPLVRLPASVLAAAAVVWCGLSPVLSILLRDGVRYPTQVGTAALVDPLALLWTLGVTGVYPVLTWTTYLLAGLAIGRLDLRSTRVAAFLLAGGAALSATAAGLSALLLWPGGGAVALGGGALDRRFYGTTPTSTWWWLAIDAPHSGAPLDLAGTTGSALAVIGLMLLLARAARPLLWLPAAIGAAPLSLYAFHVVLTTADVGTAADRPAVFIGHVVLLSVAGVALRGLGARGPLEAAVGMASRSARKLVLGAGHPAAGGSGE
ncbi:MAG: DUF1624 domain-containing protein [Pseudonocardia sp.]|nr:DUF1624 domain-containing protein [Pseudonocardia sp.]